MPAPVGNSTHIRAHWVQAGMWIDVQLSVTPWTKADNGKHLSADVFRKAMAETPGW